MVKFGYSEKATKIWWSSTWFDAYLGKRQIKWKIVSNFVAFLEKLNFNAWPILNFNITLFYGIKFTTERVPWCRYHIDIIWVV